jgi:hypothetical protein
MKNNSIQLWFRFYLLIIFTSIILFGCEIEEPKVPKNVKLTEIISEASIDQNCGEFIEGERPQSNSNTLPIISGTHQIVKGGSLILMVQPIDSAKQLIVSLRRKGPDYLSVNFGEIEPGYFLIDLGNNLEIMQANKSTNKSIKIKYKSSNSNNQVNNQLISGVGSYPLVISFSDSSKISDFDIDIAFANGSSVSKYASHNTAVNPQAASSQNLQVSLNWGYPVDLDLHVITPDGNDIYYGSPSGQNGGMLDLDSNAGCEIDNTDNENITWSNNKPAYGKYIVKVDLWSACDAGSSIPYVVSVKRNGNFTTFSGYFSPTEADNGDAFSGRYITEFTIDSINVKYLKVTSANSSNSPIAFAGQIRYNFIPNKSGYPERHLVVFYKDVLSNISDPFSLRDFNVNIEASVELNSNSVSDLNEEWLFKEKPLNTTAVIRSTGNFNSTLYQLNKGGLYKITYRPKDEVSLSEANILLPLASPEVRYIVQADLLRADAFAKRVNKEFPDGMCLVGIPKATQYTGYELKYWFFNSFHGDYIGRPDNKNNPTVWYYNQVNDVNLRGAILTWFGVPTRLGDVSYFLAGYTLTKINAPNVINLIAEYWAGGDNINDLATQNALLAGIDLAKCKITYDEVGNYAYEMFNKTYDNKNIKLWPNYYTPDNYVGSYAEKPTTFNPNLWFASPCYTNPDFKLR